MLIPKSVYLADPPAWWLTQHKPQEVTSSNNKHDLAKKPDSQLEGSTWGVDFI